MVSCNLEGVGTVCPPSTQATFESPLLLWLTELIIQNLWKFAENVTISEKGKERKFLTCIIWFWTD